ncbi:MAG: hypothetical protein ACLVBP_15650 [Ruminococcus sp.]
MEKAKAKQKSYCDSNIKEEKINGVTYTTPKSEAYQHGIVAGNISTHTMDFQKEAWSLLAIWITDIIQP